MGLCGCISNINNRSVSYFPSSVTMLLLRFSIFFFCLLMPIAVPAIAIEDEFVLNQADGDLGLVEEQVGNFERNGLEGIDTAGSEGFMEEEEDVERSVRYFTRRYTLGASQSGRLYSTINIPWNYLSDDNRIVYIVTAPQGYRIQARCTSNLFCSYFALYLSKSGRFPDAGKITKHCSNNYQYQTFAMTTDANVFQARYQFMRDGYWWNSAYRNFYCDLTAVRSTTATTTTARTTTTSPTNSCSCGKHNLAGDRIVNGDATEPHEYPFFAALSSNDMNGRRIFCGASIVSRRWVMTAAHCVEYITPSTLGGYYVVVGTDNIRTSGPNERSHAIEKIVLHENWNATTVQNDIALIKLRADITFNDKVSPVCLPIKNLGNIDEKTATVMGYGQVGQNLGTTEVLHDVKLKMESSSDCRRYSSYYAKHVTDDMICTYESSKDSCRGDSGGPLVYESNNRLYEVGIVSFGQGCAGEQKPGVYTKVAHYTNWIQRTTSETFCSP